MVDESSVIESTREARLRGVGWAAHAAPEAFLTRLKRHIADFTKGGIIMAISNGKGAEQNYFKAQWPALAIIAVLSVALFNNYSAGKSKEIDDAKTEARMEGKLDGLMLLIQNQNVTIKDLNDRIQTASDDAKVALDTVNAYRIELARSGKVTISEKDIVPNKELSR